MSPIEKRAARAACFGVALFIAASGFETALLLHEGHLRLSIISTLAHGFLAGLIARAATRIGRYGRS